MGFAKNFKDLRKKSGMNQREIALVLGLDRSAIAHYENGTSEPTLRNLMKICEFFSVSADDLIKDKE